MQNFVDQRKELERYVHHFERYNNHSKSRDIVKKTILKIREEVKLLHEVKNYPQAELKFFEECAGKIY